MVRYLYELNKKTNTEYTTTITADLSLLPSENGKPLSEQENSCKPKEGYRLFLGNPLLDGWNNFYVTSKVKNILTNNGSEVVFETTTGSIYKWNKIKLKPGTTNLHM